MARTDTQVNTRIPEALLERLRASAESAGRSLTAEIVYRLEASFRRTHDDEEIDSVIGQLMTQLKTRDQDLRSAYHGTRVVAGLAHDVLHRLDPQSMGAQESEWMSRVGKKLEEFKKIADSNPLFTSEESGPFSDKTKTKHDR